MIQHFGQLLKLKLSFTVVFSAMIGYLLGFEEFNIYYFLYLTVGGFFVTGSANGFNQILERNQDSLMQRTLSRPLPQGNLTTFKAFIFCLAIGTLGLFFLKILSIFL